MATRTVRPAGGDYTTLSAWEAGRQADLTGLGPEIAECSGNLQDTTAVIIDGWTTTAADYIQILTPQANRHAGVYDGAKYRLEPNADFSHCIDTTETHVRLEGLQVKQRNTSANVFSVIRFLGMTEGDGRVDACIVQSAGTGVDAYGISIHGSTSFIATIRNTLLYAIASDARGALYVDQGFIAGVRATNVDNCTLIGGNRAINLSGAGAMTVRNTYAHGVGTDAYTGSMTRTDCAHSSAAVFAGSTASIAHSTANFVNVTAGSENYHLVAGASATLLTGGASLSGDFTLDIDGQTRSDWSIGADEIVSAGGGPAPKRLMVMGVG